MVPWWESTLNGLTLAAAAAFTLVSISHIAAMLFLRKEFAIALRSPLLASVSGLFAAVFGFGRTVRYIVRYIPLDQQGAMAAVGAPMVVTVFQFSYVVRAIRLVVMYDPIMRRRWARLITEKVIFRTMASTTSLAVIAVMAAVPAYGMASVADKVSDIAAPLQVAVILVATACLYRKVNAIDGTNVARPPSESFAYSRFKIAHHPDIFKMSRELLIVGGCEICFYVIFIQAKSTPMSELVRVYCYIAAIVLAFCLPLLVTNIMPVRGVLRQHAAAGERIAILPSTPWRRLPGSSRVVCDRGRKQTAVSSLKPLRTTSICSVGAGGPLGDIMVCHMLRPAFEDFCRRALCSESILFLIAVAEFKDDVYAEKGEDRAFEAYIGLINEYIKDDSPSEVNINSSAKLLILRHIQRSAFMKLEREERAGIFKLAEKAIVQMLVDNLLHKFKSSEQYKQITENLLTVDQ